MVSLPAVSLALKLGDILGVIYIIVPISRVVNVGAEIVLAEIFGFVLGKTGETRAAALKGDNFFDKRVIGSAPIADFTLHIPEFYREAVGIRIKFGFVQVAPEYEISRRVIAYASGIAFKLLF